jgi:hypothetical protein
MPTMHSIIAPVRLAMPLALVAFGCAGDLVEGPSVRRTVAPPPPSAPVVAPAAQPIAPVEYLRLHNLAANPRDAGWAQALHTLAEAGDGYTLAQLKAFDRKTLTPAQVATLDETLAALEKAARPGPPSAAEITTRLERAAWADLHCDRCEHTLVPWATQSIADFASDPGVRSTLERLRDGYEPSASLAPGSQWGSLSDRVRRYAREILDGKGGQAATQTP